MTLLTNDHVYFGTCAMSRARLLQRGTIQPRMDAHLEQLLDHLLASRAGGTKPSVAPLGGQLVRTVGVTAAPLRACDGKRRREIEQKEKEKERHKDAERIEA